MHSPATGWPYRLQVPAVPEAIAWARTFAASLALSLGVDQETAADIRLTVSEFVSEVVVANHGQEMEISGRQIDGRLVLEISPWIDEEPDHRQLTAWDIASALFELRSSAGSVQIHVDLGLVSS